jgi:hypothetical protein
MPTGKSNLAAFIIVSKIFLLNNSSIKVLIVISKFIVESYC